MANYAYNQTVVTWPGGSNRILIIGSNPARVILIVAGLAGSNIALATEDGTGVDSVFYTGTVLPSSVLTFANFGTTMQNEVYMQRVSGAVTDFSITEIFKLPC